MKYKKKFLMTISFLTTLIPQLHQKIFNLIRTRFLSKILAKKLSAPNSGEKVATSFQVSKTPLKLVSSKKTPTSSLLAAKDL